MEKYVARPTRMITFFGREIPCRFQRDCLLLWFASFTSHGAQTTTTTQSISSDHVSKYQTAGNRASPRITHSIHIAGHPTADFDGFFFFVYITFISWIPPYNIKYIERGRKCVTTIVLYIQENETGPEE